MLLVVGINPEERVKVDRGPAPATLQQGGYTPVLVKVINEAGATKPLRITSPQSGPIVAGAADLSMARQDQRHLKQGEVDGGAPGRFLQVEMFTSPPMTADLSGLEVEYALALIYSGEAGQARGDDRLRRRPGDAGPRLPRRGAGALRRAAGRPGEAPRPRPRRHADRRATSRSSTARAASIPPQPKRLAPDLFFQRQIYRRDGGVGPAPAGPVHHDLRPRARSTG